MADVYADNAALILANERVSAAEIAGKMRVMADTIEAPGIADGDDIVIGDVLTEGEIVRDFLIFADDLGTAVTLQLALRAADGTETVLSSAIDVASAATVSRPVAADIANLPSVVSGKQTLIVKIAGGVATGTIKVQVFYSAAQ